MRCSVFIATSLDGFIARKDGSIDWLEDANKVVPEGEDFGYSAFTSTIDAIVMGRNTFEKVLTFGEWPYGEIPVVVLSSTLRALPDGVPPTVSLAEESPSDLVARLSGLGMKRTYVDGGVTIQRFLAAGAIFDLTVTLIPVLLGSGLPLFGPMTSDVKLEHVGTRAYECGFVQNTYRVAPAGSEAVIASA